MKVLDISLGFMVVFAHVLILLWLSEYTTVKLGYNDHGYNELLVVL
jgi:hypothetical protein